MQSIKKVKLSQISEVLLTCYINDNFLLKILIFIVINNCHTLKKKTWFHNNIHKFYRKVYFYHTKTVKSL